MRRRSRARRRVAALPTQGKEKGDDFLSASLARGAVEPGHSGEGSRPARAALATLPGVAKTVRYGFTPTMRTKLSG